VTDELDHQVRMALRPPATIPLFSDRGHRENLEAQKADLKTLSDQVADLAAKVDALRNSAAAAPVPPSIAQPVVPPQPAMIAPRKKPQPTKSAGRVSVGCAPLPIAPPSDR
jgi:hypothetical protein